jgi:glycine/D-amino acid oxidase-like deaminating enzyme
LLPCRQTPPDQRSAVGGVRTPLTVEAIPGLFIATGLSGHGFGIGPGVGYAMAQLLRGDPPVVDLKALRFSRFREPGGIVAAQEA